MTIMTRRAAAPAIASAADDDWREKGACRDEDPELFYPLGGERGHRRTGLNLLQEHDAKAVCNRCPVRVECRTWALEAGDDWGIWGGLNEAERRDLRDPKPPTGRNFVAANAARVEQRDGMCRKGLHKMTPENTYTHDGYSTCAPCRIDSQRAYRQKLRAVAHA